MRTEHEDNQMTVPQMRDAKEQREWEERKKQKALLRECRKEYQEKIKKEQKRI